MNRAASRGGHGHSDDVPRGCHRLLGAVAWISGHESVQALDASRQALAADADWLASLDREIGGVYLEVPEVTQQTFYRRVV